ncbi:hydrolase 1, exosortase A system-associated [Viridibacterium curvum]|uniref:Hydrolase 1, exosortase A system-associated n=1 Tax=Viridibacterium curvum TaxID=1101404 RepID=A0ABP9QEU9_9RHOO
MTLTTTFPIVFSLAQKHAPRLVGTVHPPAGGARGPGVVFVTGGMQTRAGSHRGFISLARVLAASGFPVLRFDLPGLGDAEGEVRDFADNADVIQAAMDALIAAVPGTERVVLWGLCDGASAAALFARDAPRVAGLFLVNPWLQSEQAQARAMRGYYRQRFLSPEFWRKLLSGRVGVVAALQGYVTNWWRARSAAPQATPESQVESLAVRLLAALDGCAVKLQIVVAGQDLTGRAFLQIAEGRNLPLSQVEEADHTFSSVAAQLRLEVLSQQFLESFCAS